VQSEMKFQNVQKRYYVIKSGVSRKRGGEISNNVLTLVLVRNDFMEG